MKTFNELIERFRALPQKPRAVAVCPDDEHTVEVIERCLRAGLASFALVAVESRTDAARRLIDEFPGLLTLDVVPDADAASRRAVELVRLGQADVVFKGNVNTDVLLRAVLAPEGLLPKGDILSHATLVEAPGHHKLFLFSDAAVIPWPTLDQFDAMVRYDVDIMRRLRTPRPVVALIHFTEKTNPKFQCTLDYGVIKERAAAGAYGDIAIGGPMDAKTACDLHSAQVKGIKSDVNGDADILILPNLEAGNAFYKTLSLFGHATMAGIVTGTTAPVVVPSRADSSDSKFYSLALACVVAKS